MNPFMDLVPQSGGANPFMDLIKSNSASKENMRREVGTNPLAAFTGVMARGMQAIPGIDELGSAIAATSALLDKNKNWGEEYQRNQQNQKLLRDETGRQHPGPSLAGDIGGILATAPLAPSVRLPGVAKGILFGAVKGLGEGALTGGLYGAATGFGQGNTLQERTQNAKDLASGGAVGGGLLGAPLGALGGSVAARQGLSRPDSDAVRKLAGSFYDEADKVGGQLTPQFTNKFINEVSKINDQTPEERIFSGPTEFSKQVRRAEFLKDKPLSLKAAQGIDKSLTRKIENFVENGKLLEEGRDFQIAQSKLRDMIREAGPGEITGGTQGFEALNKGRKAWAQSAKLRDVERIVSRAQNMDQPAKAVASGFNTLKNNPNRMRGFSPEEKKAIEKAAKTGLGVDALRVLGSRLGPIGASVAGGAAGAMGGPIGSMAGAAVSGLASHALSSTARKTAEKLQMKKANKVIQEILKGVPAVQNNMPQVMHAPKGILGPNALQYLGPMMPQIQMQKLLRGR